MIITNQNNELNPLPAYIFDAIQVIKNVPEKLKNIKNWVLWNYEERKGKKTKVLKQISGVNAKANDPDTWTSFDEALKHAHKFDGIGFVLNKDITKLTVIDLDHISEWDNPADAQKIIDSFNSYAEITPSGDGVHIIVDGLKPLSICKCDKYFNSNVEIYDNRRFMTFTGNKIEGKPVDFLNCDDELINLQNEILSAKNTSKNKVKSTVSSISYDSKTGLYSVFNIEPSTVERQQNNGIESYYSRLTDCRRDNTINMLKNGYSDSEDASACDLAVCNDLAFVTAKNPILMDQIFRESAMMRAKWDEFRGTQTYGQLTIEKAINDTKNIYSDKPLKAVESPITTAVNIDSFCLDSMDIEELESELESQVFVLPGIALKGQFTMIYAEPNAGKTLLTIKLLTQAVNEGLINGANVYYVNADDSGRGIIEKAKLMAKYHIKTLSPNFKGFKEEMLIPLIQQMIIDKTAKNKILVLDTMKKFVDLMSKKDSSEFNKQLRAFSSAGGTVICLAHVNKNKDNDGKVVHAGTSDTNDDCDCSFILNVKSNISDSFQGMKIINKTVEFEQKKARGDVEQSITYTYRTVKGTGYLSMFDSIKKVDEKTAEWTAKQEAINQLVNDHKDGISCVTNAIKQGITTKGALIEYLMDEEGLTKPKARKLIDDHEGDNFQNGHRWKRENSGKNTSSYSLLTSIF